MRIRSQNKELMILEPFGTIYIDQDDTMTAYGVYVHVPQGKLLVGEYSTKEKAEKVLDRITANLNLREKIGGAWNMPGGVFQMPRDEEVEIMEASDQTRDFSQNKELEAKLKRLNKAGCGLKTCLTRMCVELLQKEGNGMNRKGKHEGEINESQRNDEIFKRAAHVGQAESKG